MSHDLGRAHPCLLVLVQHFADVLLANRMDPLRDSHFLVPHVCFVPEWEATTDETVHDDAHGPHVDLLTVVAIEELWRPEDFRSNARREAVGGACMACSSKIREDDLALLVRHVLPVHEVVVTFHVPVNDVPLVQVVDGGGHLVRNMDHVEAVNLTALLEVTLESLHKVTSIQLVHDNTHEAPLVVDAVKLDNIGVVHARKHIGLLPNGLHRGLHLVHHLYSELLASGPSLADRDNTKRTLAKRDSNGIFIQ
mmetsp:Transcript_60949/g.142570  ORF Transcript_60949/g.142570 Transcript_60949/m.142570 type:complete len:252 (-) Transcript_60949:181-936(-)